jgi:hypothetical protein
MAKQLQFKEAVLLAQETAAAEDKRKLQVMLFPMLQKQHDKQIAAMAATNNANTDAMMERMNALVTGGGGRKPTHQDKEITPTAANTLPTSTGSGTNQPKKTKRHKCICPHCKMFALHKPKKLCQTGGEQGQALARLEVGPYQCLTNTGDHKSRPRYSSN